MTHITKSAKDLKQGDRLVLTNWMGHEFLHPVLNVAPYDREGDMTSQSRKEGPWLTVNLGYDVTEVKVQVIDGHEHHVSKIVTKANPVLYRAAERVQIAR